jgi:capsid protein
MLIEEAVLRGELKAPNFFEKKSEWLNVRWVADGWEWIDPLKEVKAAIEGKDANIINLADIAASRGQDWEEVLEQSAREKAKIKELEKKFGVDFTQQKPQAVNSKGSNDDTTDGANNQESN